MAKRKSSPYMSPGEQIAGTVFFVIYLVVLPFATAPLFRLAERLLAVSISPSLQNAIYYYTLFAVTILIFHGFIGRTTRNFADNLGNACKAVVVGLIALYGLNELVYRLTRLLVNNHTNLNDSTISAQIHDAPRVTLLIVIFLAPFVEEVLFRGLMFWKSEAQEPHCRLCRKLSAVRPAPCLAVCREAAGHYVFSADGTISGSGTGAGVGL